MYIQYKNKEGKIYSLDVSELSYSVLLLMFCWIIPKKLYLTEGIYKAERKGWLANRSFTTIAVSVIVTSKLIKFEWDPTVLFETNYFTASIILIICFVISFIIAKCYSKIMRRKMLKHIQVNKEQAVLVKFKPNNVGSWIIIIFLLYIAVFSIPQCLGILINPEIGALCTTLAINLLIVAMPTLVIGCCSPIIDGEKLERIPY